MKSNKIIDVIKNKFTKDKETVNSLENLQARLLVSTLDYNNSFVIVDDNGESHTSTNPNPVEEEFLVKLGDQMNGFEVLSLTPNFIELRSSAEYTSDNTSTPSTQFVIEKGECIHLRMWGVYDAVHSVFIRYIEAVTLAE